MADTTDDGERAGEGDDLAVEEMVFSEMQCWFVLPLS